MEPTPEQVEREILEAMARYLKDEHQPAHPEIWMSGEGLRTMTRFGVAAHLGEEFLGRLHAMQGKGFVSVMFPFDGGGYKNAMVSLTPKGVDRLLYPNDEDYLAQQRPGGPTISNTFQGPVQQFAMTTGPNSPVDQSQTVTDWNSLLPLVERLREEVKNHPEIPEDATTEVEQLRLEAKRKHPKIERITDYLNCIKNLAGGVVPIVQIVRQILQMLNPHSGAGSGPVVP
jgi:hypothetical protein